MRKITKDAVRAFLGGYKFNRDNTSVVWCEFNREWVFKLHGNTIAKRSPEYDGLNKFRICDGGWSSNTTKERLNGLLPIGQGIHQKNWQWYLNNEPWDGTWTEILV